MPNREIPRGVALVALMALSKKEFFQQLLENPRAALDRVKAELELRDDEVPEVVAVIEEARQGIDRGDALRAWDTWRSTGIWLRPVLWPTLIPPFWPMMGVPDRPNR